MTSNETALSILANAGLPETEDEALALMKQHVEDEDAPTGVGGDDFLSMRQEDGCFIFGRNKEEVGSDDLFLCTRQDAEQGWMCWHNGKPVRKGYAPLTAPKVDKPEDLPANETGRNKGRVPAWHRSYKFKLHITSGEHEGTAVIMEGVNAGFSGMGRQLFAEMIKQQEKGGGYTYPLFQLYASDKDDQGARYPRWRVVDWLNAEGKSRADAGKVEVKSVEVVEETPDQPKGKRRSLR